MRGCAGLWARRRIRKNKSMADYAIEVDGLAKTFGDFTAVGHISFRVPRGSIFGFLGPNGAGKSTTIRMLCGLLEPTSGSASVGGFDIVRQTGQLKKNIGYMSQKFSLYEDLTVEENIRFFGGVYGLSSLALKERMKWVVEMAGLEGREKSLTGTLAGGWKQRLALGCAIIHEPAIVFLDEPTSGVDPVSRRNFWELINGLSEKGTTVLVTTHYLDEAEYCNNIIMMDAGKIVADGSPKELKKRHITYQMLELQADDVVVAMELLKPATWVRELSLFGMHLHVGVDDAATGAEMIRRTMAAGGRTVGRIELITPSLEDVFIRVVAGKAE